jgi:hypothetical protein
MSMRVRCDVVCSGLLLLTISAAAYPQESAPVQTCACDVIADAPTPAVTGPLTS